jgi:hypothetical protein
LVDCGATGLFIDSGYVERNGIQTQLLHKPIPVFNVDGIPNEAGMITRVTDLILRYKDYAERTTFAVTSLGKEDVILGYTWLREHNPEVDWQTQEVKMTRCPRKCETCRREAKAESLAQKANIRRLNTCRAGPMPTLVDDDADADVDLEFDEEEIVYDLGNGEVLENGDRIFATTIPSEGEFIRAGSTVSQQLAEAFQKNSSPSTTRGF